MTLLSPHAARLLLSLTTLALAGCIPAVVVGVAASSGGGGGGGGSGGGSTTSAAAFSVSPVSGHQDAQFGSEVEIVIAPGGPSLNGAVPSVSVEGLPTSQVTVLAADRFRIVLPDNPRGNKTANVSVVITLPGWRAETSIQYRAVPPTISGVNPSQVSTSGSSVTVSGTGFVEGTVVEIGSHIVFPSSLSARSLNIVTPQAPAGATLDLNVRHPEGFQATLAAALSVVVGPATPPPSTITIVNPFPAGPFYTRQQLKFEVEVRDPSGNPAPDGYRLVVEINGGGHFYQTTGGRAQIDERLPEHFGPAVLTFLDAAFVRIDPGITLNVVRWDSGPLKGWEPRRTGLTGVDARALARAPDDPLVLFTGGPGGLWWSPDDGAQWTSRPIPGNPAVQGLEARTGGRVFAATTSGVWRSLDAGLTWAARNTGLPSLNASAVAVTQSGSLIAATAGGVALSADEGGNWIAGGSLAATPRVLATASSVDRTFVGAGAEVHRSLDGGATWTRVDSGFSGSPVSALACSADGLTLAAGLESGLVYRSSDAGASWTPGSAVSTAGRPIADLATLGGAWVCAVRGQGVFRSGDTGPWEPRSGCLGDRDLYALAIRDLDRWALAAGAGGVWRTLDAGRGSPWRWLERLPTAAASVSDAQSLEAMEDGNALFARFLGGAVALKSSDRGQSWFTSPTVRQGGGGFTEGDRQRFYFNQGWASHDGGGSWFAVGSRQATGEFTILADQRDQPLRVYRHDSYSQDGGLTFQALARSVQVPGPSYTFAQSTSNPDRLYLLAQNTRLVYRSNDRGLSWGSPLAGPAGSQSLSYLVVDPLDQDRLLGANRITGQPEALYLSPDAGATWFQVASGVGRPLWSQTSGRLYTDSHRSLDQGATWSAWTGGLGGAETLKTLALRGSDDDAVLHATTATGLYRSTDLGAGWTAVPSAPRVATSGTLSVQPTRPTAWFHSGSRSSDSGLTWTSVSFPAGTLGFDAVDPAQLYAYSSGSLHRSDDDGANWVALTPPAGTLQIDPNVADRVWLDPGSTQDLQVSNDGGQTWSQVSGTALRSGYSLVRGQSDRVFLWTGGALKSSSDAGLTWTAVNLPTLSSITGAWGDSQDAQVLYLKADTGLFGTTTGGTEWHPVNFGGLGFQTLLPSPTTRGRFLFRSSSTQGLARSDDAGLTVYPINGGLGPYASDLRWAGQPGHYLINHARKWALTTTAGN